MSKDSAAKLTARQQQVFDLVRRAIERTGSPPTRAELAQELGFRSANAAEEHLQALARKGVIELVGGTSRGIRLPRATLREVNAARREPQQVLLPLPGIAQLSLPLVGRVAAGQPILAEEHITQTFAVDPSLFSRTPDYLLRVRGLSMKDAGILDGDLLAVKKAGEARDGQIVVARLADEVTVKYLERHAGGVRLLPANADFSPIEVDASLGEGFAIEGIAVGLLRTQAWQ